MAEKSVNFYIPSVRMTSRISFSFRPNRFNFGNSMEKIIADEPAYFECAISLNKSFTDGTASQFCTKCAIAEMTFRYHSRSPKVT